MEYARPATIDEACSLLWQHGEGAKVIAGGVALAILLKERLVEPEILVDIEGVPSLKHISHDGGGLKLGALCTHREIEKSPLVREKFPCLGRAAEHIGCVQIRNAGTVGGSLCHADPASDLAPLLIAMEAEVNINSTQGDRRVLLEDFFTDYYQTVLGAGEILTEIRLPSQPARTGIGYMKYVMREGDMAIVGAAAMLTLDEDRERCLEARIVLSAVGPTPLRVEEAEEALRGKIVGERSLRNAADAAMEASRPLPGSSGSEQYKREMAGVMTRRAISQALQQAAS
jgi:carbon-monoxide dehydrogenase medium subunit